MLLRKSILLATSAKAEPTMMKMTKAKSRKIYKAMREE
jgi:hypothetical protein